MSDLISHFLRPAEELLGHATQAAGGYSPPQKLREIRRAAEGVIRGLEDYKQRLDEDGDWPVPPERATLFVPLPDLKWEQARDALSWQRCLRREVDVLLGRYRSMTEKCFDITPGPFPGLDAGEEALRKHRVAVAEAFNELDYWRKEIETSRVRLHQFGMDMALYRNARPEDAGPQPDSPKVRPCYDRDHTWLTWQAEGMTPAQIRDRWNREHPEQSVSGGEPGRDLVKKALNQAKKDRGK